MYLDCFTKTDIIQIKLVLDARCIRESSPRLVSTMQINENRGNFI